MSRTEPVDILEEAVDIPHKDKRLAGVLAYPFAGRPTGAALVVGPHPLMGGRLENNVVRHVGRGLAEHGLLSLRFQFDDSTVSAQVMEQFWATGRAPEDPHRGGEAAAALAWLTRQTDDPPILVGYSFGASLLQELATSTTRGVVLIGPTLCQHDYTTLARQAVPKLVFAADNDFASPLHVTHEWAAHAAAPVQLIVMPAAEHFYRGQEGRLVEEIIEWMPA